MPVFVCPTYGRAVGHPENGDARGLSTYLGVSGGIAHATDGLLFPDSAIVLTQVSDGASNTILIGERPPSADENFGWWYAGLGQGHFDHPDGSLDCVMPAREVNRTFYAPTCRYGPYPFQDGDPADMCSTFHYWSEHPGGANFAFADGSVRFLRYAADAVLPALATRAGNDSAPLE